MIQGDIVAERSTLIRDMMRRIRSIAEPTITREALNLIKDELLSLAARRTLFPIDEFPPIEGGNSSMYLLSEDGDHRYALYMVAPSPGGFAPPHEHQTWAVIAGMYGREKNKIYRRMDDGAEPGVARLEFRDEIDVVAGTAIALLPEDIHSIHLGEDGPHGNLHLYGLSVEHCNERRLYSLSKNTYKTFPSATGIVSARGAMIGENQNATH